MKENVIVAHCFHLPQVCSFGISVLTTERQV